MSKPRLQEAGGCERQRLVLAWRGCGRQTAVENCFAPFFSPKIWGFYCAQGHPYSSPVIWGGGVDLVYFHTAGILGGPTAGPAGHSKHLSFLRSWVQCQSSTARAAGTCADTFGIQVLILIVWLCLDLCLLCGFFFFFLEV